MAVTALPRPNQNHIIHILDRDNDSSDVLVAPLTNSSHMNDIDFGNLFNSNLQVQSVQQQQLPHDSNHPTAHNAIHNHTNSEHAVQHDPPAMPFPHSTLPETMMPKSNCSGDNSVILSNLGEQVIIHPLYPDLVKAIMDCRKVGATEEICCHIDIRTDNVLQDLHRKREALSVQGRLPRPDPELDQFLQQYIQVLVELHAELLNINREADNVLHMFNSQIAEIIGPCGEARAMTASYNLNNVDMSWFEIKDEAEQRSLLKQKYRQELLALKEEFSKRKKRGKLPQKSIEVLKSWWKEHIAWPYPTDSAKRKLAGQTGLTSIQINNWFINQRKRHWHKLFPEGVPSSQEEALRSLRARGISVAESARMPSTDMSSQDIPEGEAEEEVQLRFPNDISSLQKDILQDSDINQENQKPDFLSGRVNFLGLDSIQEGILQEGDSSKQGQV